MLVEDVALDAAELGAVVELDADVEIERTHGHLLIHEDFLGAAQDVVARGGVDRGGGLGDESVVFRIAPAGAVVAAAGDEHVEERVGVGVVADPARAGDVVVERAQRAQVNLPFLAQELDVDPEFAAPHALQLHGDGLVEFALAVEVGDHGKTLAAGEAGLGEQAPGLVRVAPRAAGERVVAARSGRNKAVGRQFAGAGDAVHDGLLVDDEAEGAAHARVGERALGAVVAQEVGAEERRGVEVVALLDLAEERGRDEALVHHEVGLSGRVEVEGGVGLAHGDDVDGLEGDVGGVPVARVLAQADAVVEPPLLEHVGAVAD